MKCLWCLCAILLSTKSQSRQQMPVSNTPATASVSTHLLSWDREVHNILGLYFWVSLFQLSLVCVSQTFACVFTWWFSHWVGLLWCIESASDHARDLCPVLLFVIWADSCRPFCCTPFAAFVVFFLCYMGLGWSGFLWIKRQRFSFWGSFRYARFLCWLVVRLFCYLHLGSLSLSVLHGSCLLILSSLPGSSP